MSTQLKLGQLPLSLAQIGKRDVRTQFAALCYRVEKKSKTKVLLVTSRTSGRWIVPKGWPMDDRTPTESAVIEAWEEAGVHGKAEPGCVGIYSYEKELDTGVMLPVIVAVFGVRVEKLDNDYAEATQRERKWVSPKKAARMVDEPDLALMLRDFKRH